MPRVAQHVSKELNLRKSMLLTSVLHCCSESHRSQRQALSYSLPQPVILSSHSFLARPSSLSLRLTGHQATACRHPCLSHFLVEEGDYSSRWRLAPARASVGQAGRFFPRASVAQAKRWRPAPSGASVGIWNVPGVHPEGQVSLPPGSGPASGTAASTKHFLLCNT